MEKHNIYPLVQISVMTALVCVFGPFTLPIGPIPVSLVTFAIYTVSLVMGWKKALICSLLYLAIGFLGVPVFSGFSGGVGVLLGPTGGYLFGYLFIAVLTGIFADISSDKQTVSDKKKKWLSFVGMVLGTVICYTFGTVWLSYQMELSIGAAFGVGVVPFLLGDTIKMLAACHIAGILKKQMSHL